MNISNVHPLGNSILHFDKKIDNEKELYKEIVKTINSSNKFNESEKTILVNVISSEDKISKLFNHYRNFPIGTEVTSLPISEFELISNLDKVINNYPNIFLGNDLTIYNKNNLPKDTDVNIIFEKLKSEKNRLIHSLDTTGDTDNSIKIAALMQINAVLNIYVPKKIIPVTFFLQNTINKDSSDIFLDACKEAVKSNSPIVLTKTIIYNQVAPFENLLKDKDIYFQKNGSFVLVLGKGEEPKSLGFNSDHLEKWEGPFSDIPAVPLNFSSDLNHLFLKNQEDIHFERIISLQGHGRPPNPEIGEAKGEVSGLPMDEFHEGLETLKNNNMVFLHLFTCFGGGENSTQLHSVGGEIPCPVLVESSLELPAFSSKEGYEKLFNKAESLLFKNTQGEKEPKILHQLSQANLSELARLTPMSLTQNSATYMYCLPMALLPTPLAEVSKVSYIQPTLKGIIDIQSEQKKQNAIGIKVDILNVPQDQSTLLFSSPIIDNKIVIYGSDLTLLSRGGTSQHLVRELEAPNVDIEQIAKKTFAIGMGFSSPDKKAYYFGKIKCKYNGELRELENCMLKKTNKECYLLFKVKGEENFTYVNYIEEKNNFVPKNQTNKLTSKEAELLVYDTLKETQPSKGNLEQIGVKPFDSSKDIFHSFSPLFWHNNESQAAVESAQKLDTDLMKLESEFEQTLSHLSKEEVMELLNRSPTFFRYIDSKWRNDITILSKIIPTYPKALEFVDTQTVKDIIKILPARKGFLRYCNSQTKENEEIVALFLKHNLFGNIDFCTMNVRNNSNLMLLAVSLYNNVFPFLGEDLKNNEEFLIKCLDIAPAVFKNMSERARSNPLIIEKALAKDPNLQKYVRESLSL